MITCGGVYLMGSVCASTCGYDDKAVWVRLGKMERGCTAGARGAAGDQDSRGMRTWLTRSASNLKRGGGEGEALGVLNVCGYRKSLTSRNSANVLTPSWTKPHHKSPLDEINEIRRNAADSLWVLKVTRRRILPLTAII